MLLKVVLFVNEFQKLAFANTNWAERAAELGLGTHQAQALQQVVLQLKAGDQGHEIPRFPTIAPHSQRRDTLGTY